MDFKEQLEDKMSFGKSLKNFAPKYDETARDVVAFANNKGGFLFIGIVDGSKEVNQDFVYSNENQTGKAMKLDELLVLSEAVKHKHIKLSELSNMQNISNHRLQSILDKLCNLEFLETSDKTSGLSYILHVSKRKNMNDKIEYVNTKKQEKARQKEAILWYLDSIQTINNTEARQLLKLSDRERSKVSRLFAELVSEKEISQTEDSFANNVKYRRLRK